MKKILVTIIFAFTICLAPASFAQTSRGTVSGTLTDETGAVIPNASVTLTNTATNVARTTTANEEGFYRFDAVDLGTYFVQIAASNFGTVTRTGVIVNANQTSTIDAQLTIGTQAETVEVTATSGELLQTEAPVRGGNISTRQITDLPFAGRNPTALTLTLPGVTTNRSGVGIGTFSVNGARSRSNNFLIDGTENNDISVAGQGLQITNPDAVQEVSVQTSNYDAEFGRAGGAVVNVITKSGRNDIFGTLSFLYDTRTDDALTSSESRDEENRLRGEPPSGTEYFAAGTIGGPVVLPRFGEGGDVFYDGRNRTFFFGYFQENRQRSTSQFQLLTPTAPGRERLRQVFAPGASANVDLLLFSTQSAIGSSDPLSSPQNVAIGARPGCPAPCNIQFGTFNRNFAQLSTNRQYLIRIDHRLGDNDQLSGRFISDRSDNPLASPRFEGFDSATLNRNYNFQTAYTRVFSPTVTNELRVAYNRIQFGFTLTDPDGLAGTLPRIAFGLATNSQLGVATNLPQGRTANNYVIQDTITKVAGNHTFRGGVDFLRQIATQSAPFNSRGSLTYSAGGGFTAFGNFVDDFGGGSGTVTRDFGSPMFFPSLYRTRVFFQDRWKATDALTLTLGLAYENFGTPFNKLRTPAFTGLFNVDPVTLQGVFDDPNQVPADNNNFAPTVGLAYSPSFTGGLLGGIFGERKTVLRAGYQIGYDSFFNNIASNVAASSPNTIVTTISSNSDAGARGITNFSNAFPTSAASVLPSSSQGLLAPNLVNPYYQRFSAGLQRELGFSIVLDASYVGSKGTKLFITEDYNPTVRPEQRITPANYAGPNCTPNSNITPAQALPGFPAGRICPLTGRLDNLQGARGTRTNGGSSSYHSGQLEVRRRFAGNFQITGAYTFSKLIDNNSEVFALTEVSTAAGTSALPTLLGGDRLERAVSNFDRTHRASFTYVFEVPFLREQRGALGKLLGGFQISGVTSFESGVPFTVFNGLNSDGIAGALERPDFNPNGQRGVRAVPEIEPEFITVNNVRTRNPNFGALIRYFNPDVIDTETRLPVTIDPRAAQFIVNPTYIPGNPRFAGVPRFGNLGRNTERSPGINNFNVNILKRTRLTERKSFEFRTEFYNIFNHPQYTTGSVSPFSPGGGGIDSNANAAPEGFFLNPNTPNTDGGGRVIRYQVKFIF
ncbi:MAG: carboxypeptidase regulatory-like domain-containing protein [Pyrinomonadaceae bacterium MAG19_C2-C3]|nr:carboxypeptidase regulatory-like domain-containing protein [Pyrinomonadaceae bacterium MAG19_C2-C3]